MHHSLLIALPVAPLSEAAALSPRGQKCEITPPDYPEPEGNTYPQLLALAMECAKEELEAWDRSLSYLTQMTARGQRENPGVMSRNYDLLTTPLSNLISAALKTPPGEDNPALPWLMDEYGDTLAAMRHLLAGPCLQPRGVADDERGRQMLAFRNAGRLLMLQARALQEGGDLDGALRVLADLMHLGEVLTRNAPLIQALTGIAVFLMAAHPLPACIHDERTSDDALAELALRLREAWDQRVPAAETLSIDWVVSQEAADRAGADAPMPRFPPLRWLGMRCRRGIQDRERAATCHAIALSRQPRWERKPVERLFRRTIAPEVHLKACDSFDTRDAILARLRLQVVLEQYRRRHGEAPGALADLVPDFIERMQPDPFTGDDLHYEPGAGGYRLYSQAETEGGAAWRGQDPPTYSRSVAQR